MSNDYVQGELIYYAKRLSKDFKNLELIPLSDVHYGNHLHSPKHFKRTIDYIKDHDNCFTFLNGDLCECAIKASKGDVYQQKISPQSQRDDMVDFLMPIKHKILGMTIGNHEARILNDTSIDICKDIAKALDVPYRPEGMLIKIMFGDNNKGTTDRPYTYWGYFTHGYGGARTTGAKNTKVERTSTFIHADFYVMSHDHVANASPVVYLMPDPRVSENDDGHLTGTIRAVRKILVKSNSYVKWGGYSETGGFSPSDLTTPIIYLSGTGKPEVRALI